MKLEACKHSSVLRVGFGTQLFSASLLRESWFCNKLLNSLYSLSFKTGYMFIYFKSQKSPGMANGHRATLQFMYQFFVFLTKNHGKFLLKVFRCVHGFTRNLILITHPQMSMILIQLPDINLFPKSVGAMPANRECYWFLDRVRLC